MHSQRLLQRISPFEHEDAFGFLNRIATANHIKDAYQIIEHALAIALEFLNTKILPRLLIFA